MRHDLFKHQRHNHYECRVCGQIWQYRPTIHIPCPGVKVYPIYDHVPLMTREQLGYLGYDNSEDSLPPTVGCYDSPGEGGYVWLYDPAQVVKRQGHARSQIKTVKKQKRARSGIRTATTRVIWPVKALPLIQSFNDFLQDHTHHHRDIRISFIHELANMAAHFATFTPNEIERFAGSTISLTISPTLARRSYASPQSDWIGQMAFALRIAAAYERRKAAL
jgi:hypothetical protein